MPTQPTPLSPPKPESTGGTLPERIAQDLHEVQTDETFFAAAPVGLAKVSPEGKFLDVNRYLCELTGYSRAELLQRHVKDVTHPDDMPESLSWIQRMMAGEIADFTVDKRYVRKDGTIVWVNLRASVVRHNGGEPAYGIAVTREIATPALAPEPPAPVTYAGIRVDLARLDAVCNGVGLGLSPKELLLLWYLVHHQGEVVTRETLFRNVWGYDFDCRSRTLDVHICRLRRKTPPLNNLLMTVGRIGYTLRSEPSARPMRIAG